MPVVSSAVSATATAIALRRKWPSGTWRVARRSSRLSSSQRPRPSHSNAPIRHSSNGVRFDVSHASLQASATRLPRRSSRARSSGKLRAGSLQNALPNGDAVRDANRAWNSSLRRPVICAASCKAFWPSSCACLTCASSAAPALSSCRRWAATCAASGAAPLAGGAPSTSSCACSAASWGVRSLTSCRAWSCTASASLRKSPSELAARLSFNAALSASRRSSNCCSDCAGVTTLAAEAGAASPCWACTTRLPKASRISRSKRHGMDIRA